MDWVFPTIRVGLATGGNGLAGYVSGHPYTQTALIGFVAAVAKEWLRDLSNNQASSFHERGLYLLPLCSFGALAGYTKFYSFKQALLIYSIGHATATLARKGMNAALTIGHNPLKKKIEDVFLTQTLETSVEKSSKHRPWILRQIVRIIGTFTLARKVFEQNSQKAAYTTVVAVGTQVFSDYFVPKLKSSYEAFRPCTNRVNKIFELSPNPINEPVALNPLPACAMRVLRTGLPLKEAYAISLTTELFVNPIVITILKLFYLKNR